MNVVNVGRPSAARTHLFSTKESTLERGLISAANVGKPTVINPRLFSMRVSTPEKGLMSAVNVGNLLAKTAALFYI